MVKYRWILSLVLLMAFTLHPQVTTGKGRMKGIVLDKKTGEPIEGVTVKLYSELAAAFYTSFPKTGNDGRWRVNFIRGGKWIIDFLKPGYKTEKISFKVRALAIGGTPLIKVHMYQIEGSEMETGLKKEMEAAINLYKKNLVKEALLEFKRIGKKNQNDGVSDIIHRYMGNCYAVLKQYEKAIIFFQRALQNDPEDIHLMLSIGNAYTNLNRPEKANQWFKRVPFYKIGDINTLYNIGAYHYNHANYQQAVKFFKRALLIKDTFIDAIFQLGMAHIALNNTKEGVGNLKTFLQMAPESPDYQTAKAIVDAFSRQMQ